MWIFFSGIAMIAALCNLIWTAKGKEAKRFMFISLSFTALTLCAFYSADAKWVIEEDWGALADVTPMTSKALWVCTVASVGVNSVSLFQRVEK